MERMLDLCDDIITRAYAVKNISQFLTCRFIPEYFSKDGRGWGGEGGGDSCGSCGQKIRRVSKLGGKMSIVNKENLIFSIS